MTKNGERTPKGCVRDKFILTDGGKDLSRMCDC